MSASRGGLSTGRPTLVCGGPGSGKTLLALTFLVNGAVRFDEPGVLMTFEENGDEIASDVASLTLVRRLVELHGGTVIATSEGEGQGSTFTLRLPLCPPAHSSGTIDSRGVEVSPRRVLIIEDDTDARQMFRLMLEIAGHTVYDAADGARGLELLESEHPEIAIIDIGLPGLNGYQVARRIRAVPNGGAVVLVALTGYGRPSDYQRSIDAGFDHHLVKPVDPERLAYLLQTGARRVEAPSHTSG